MMSTKFNYSLLCLLLSSPLALATNTANEPLGKTLLAQGSIQAERSGAKQALKRLSPVYRTDVIRSGKDSNAQFRMIDNAYLDLYENSELRLHEYQLKADGQRGSVIMELISGGLRTISGIIGKQNKSDYQLRTPTATIGIRGTFYEVSLTKEGMYLAAWKGGITIKTHSGACNTALGLGQQANFAFVDQQGQCELLTEAPPVFTRKAPKPKANQGGALALAAKENIDPVRTVPKEEELPSGGGGGSGSTDDGKPLARQAIIITPAQQAIKGSASQTTQGTPTLKVKGELLTTQPQHVQQYSQPLSQFDVQWGRWANYQLSSGKETPNQHGLMWISYQGTPKAVLEQRSGSAHYDHLLASSVQSSMGEVSKLKVGMNIDFNSGKITEGKISAEVPHHTWQGQFNGQLSAGDLALKFQQGQLINHANHQASSVNGSISGDFVGNFGQAIVGGFDMYQANNPANHINGAFLIQEPDGH